MRISDYETMTTGTATRSGGQETVRRKRHGGRAAQKTLARMVHVDGVGLHTGEMIHLTIHPVEANHGIEFHRVDLGEQGHIPARHDHVVDTTLSTMIGNEHGATVSTVEHLMSALSAMGVDNALVMLDGPEVPVLDGSSEPFIRAIESAGLIEQAAPRMAIRILKPVVVEDGLKRAALLPGEGFRLSFEIEFESKAIGRQKVEADLRDPDFIDDVLSARTFCMRKDIEAMWEAGLARGGSLENAVVVDGDEILNEEGLRYRDEFVRHKMLDAVGDLALSGLPLIGAYEGERAGHAMNSRVLKALMADETAYEIVEFSSLPRFVAEPRERAVAIPAE